MYIFSLCFERVVFAGLYGLSTIICSSSNGRDPNSVDSGVKSVEKLLEEKRGAELSARIASGEFTVEQSGYALEFTMLLVLAILIVNVVGIRCVCLLFYLFLLKNCVDFTPIAPQRILQRQS